MVEEEHVAWAEVPCDVSVENNKMEYLHWDVAGVRPLHILWYGAQAVESRGVELQEEPGTGLQQHVVPGMTNHCQNLKDDEEAQVDVHYGPCRPCHNRASRSSSSVSLSFAAHSGP